MCKKLKKLVEVLNNFEIEEINLSKGGSELKLRYTNYDAEAAWQMYVELVTRVLTQPLGNEDGDEQSALTSIYKIFEITRFILKEYGRKAKNFTTIAIIILNQKVRPFTAKWHLTNFGFDNNREKFRIDLRELQKALISYSRLLADMANVRDLTTIEANKEKELISVN